MYQKKRIMCQKFQILPAIVAQARAWIILVLVFMVLEGLESEVEPNAGRSVLVIVSLYASSGSVGRAEGAVAGLSSSLSE